MTRLGEIFRFNSTLITRKYRKELLGISLGNTTTTTGRVVPHLLGIQVTPISGEILPHKGAIHQSLNMLTTSSGEWGTEMTNEPKEDIVSWRLSKLEDGVKEINRKMDEQLSVKTQIATLGVLVDGLMKSRDKQIAALTGIGVSVVLIVLELVFNLV